MTESFSLFKIIFVLFGGGGLLYSIYCQTKASQHISREKIVQLKDLSIIANGNMPPKEILSEEGLKYHKGFLIGTAIFAVSIVLALFLSLVSHN